MNIKKIKEKAVIFLLFLSAAFSISYWAIAKYNPQDDYLAASGDTESYMNMSRRDYVNVQQRYRYRALMPFMVSLLNEHLKIGDFLSRYYEDVDSKIVQLNFGIVNILAITFSAFLFYFYCLYLKFSKSESLIGSFLYLTSFFVVTYYTLPLVDSLAAFFIMAGFYAVLKGSLVGLFLSFGLGVFAKETTFVILPLIVLAERKVFSKKLLVCLPGIIAYAIFVLSLEKSKFDRGGFYFFSEIINIVKGQYLQDSLVRFSPYTLIEYTQIFMFLWVLFIYALFKCKKPDFLKRVSWLLLAPLITPFFGCDVIGRVVFYFFPIVIPFAMLTLRDILNYDTANINKLTK